MVVRNIKVGTIENVKRLCNAATKQIFDIDLGSGRYIIDAKSIMGVFSLDLSKEIQIKVHASEDEAAEFLDAIADMLV